MLWHDFGKEYVLFSIGLFQDVSSIPELCRVPPRLPRLRNLSRLGAARARSGRRGRRGRWGPLLSIAIRCFSWCPAAVNGCILGKSFPKKVRPETEAFKHFKWQQFWVPLTHDGESRSLAYQFLLSFLYKYACLRIWSLSQKLFAGFCWHLLRVSPCERWFQWPERREAQVPARAALLPKLPRQTIAVADVPRS